MLHFTSFFFTMTSNLFVVFLLLNAAYTMAKLHLNSRVHLASFAIMPYRQLKYSKVLSEYQHLQVSYYYNKDYHSGEDCGLGLYVVWDAI